MSNSIRKPKLSSEQLITKLHDEKGVSFSIVTESDAVDYLKNRNNYLRTASYRKNYPKHIKGEKEGQYIHLDFAYLKELSTIDMYLRRHILDMSIDLEHALKVKLVQQIEQDSFEDGYSIISDFISANEYVRQNLQQKANNVFTGELIAKYFTLQYTPPRRTPEITAIDCPIWVFVELITFGEYINLYDFYAKRCAAGGRPDPAFVLDRKILNPIKSLRNACAHNNCLLVDLSKGNTTPPAEISNFVAQIQTIGKGTRKKRLACRPLFEIVCLLYYYQKFVSLDVCRHEIDALKSFTNGRMISHMDYFEGASGNPLIFSSLNFIRSIVNSL